MSQGIQYQFAKKVLHIRLDKVGDLLLSTPLIRAIHEEWKERQVEIHCLVTPYTREILEDSPFVDDIKVFSEKWGVAERLNFLSQLKSEKFDLAIAHSPTTMSYLAAFMSGAPHRIGYVYEERPLSAKLVDYVLTDSVKINIRQHLTNGEKVPHEVEQSFMIADRLGVKIKHRDLYLEVTPEDKKHAEAQFKKWLWEPGKKIFGIHLSNKWLKLGWTVQHFHRLVSDIQKKWRGSYVLFTYGSYEVDIGREIQNHYQNNSYVNCSWDTTIKQWAAMLKKCSYLITTDTGAVHIAASQKVPLVVVYDPDSYDLNSQQWAPWRVKHKKLTQKAPLQLIREIISNIETLDSIY